ncbi:MAG: amino acid ABC transporter permease [Firmicutes bacterium]|nr:amino acid ABC transporter permease [Bacillota bacterium]
MSLSIMLEQLGMGMMRSVGLFAWTLILSIPLGLLVSFGRMSKNFLLRNIIKLYIAIMRGTPLMLQLLIIYFGPFYLWHANIGGYRYAALIIGFTLNYAAYFAEIFRSGIQSMPAGQYEAADVLGYGRTQTFIKIILPQVIKRVLPPVTNETITLVKDTSLAYALAYSEMFSLAKQISAAQASFMPLVIAGVFYFVFNYFVQEVMIMIEKKLNYYR